MAVSIIVKVIILALYLLLAIGVRKGIIPGFASTLIAVFASIAIAIFFYQVRSLDMSKGMILEWIDANHKPFDDLALAH